jgi:hypothetical protein
MNHVVADGAAVMSEESERGFKGRHGAKDVGARPVPKERVDLEPRRGLKAPVHPLGHLDGTFRIRYH